MLSVSDFIAFPVWIAAGVMSGCSCFFGVRALWRLAWGDDGSYLDFEEPGRDRPTP